MIIIKVVCMSNKKKSEIIKRLKSLKQKINFNIEKRLAMQEKRRKEFNNNHKVLYDEIYWKGVQSLK